MNICLVSQEYPPETGGGGIGTQTYLKARGLAARGHEVHVVSASWDAQARTYRDGAVQVHRIAEPSQKLSWHELSTYWLAYSLAVAEKLEALCAHVRFDIMQFPEYAADGFVYQTENFATRKSRYSVQCHGPLIMFVEQVGWPAIDTPLQTIGCFMEGEVIRRSDLLLASSHAIAELCATRHEVPLEGIHVIHSAVDLDRFHPQRATTTASFPNVLFVGNFVGAKGFDLLIDAALQLTGDYPRMRVRMVGKGDPAHVDRAKARVARAQASDNFEFIGYVSHDELPQHYGWCHVFAGPSTYEPGAANVYLEAMASGRPVIACRSGGAPEAVQDLATGLLISPGSVSELTAALRRLADDELLRASLGSAGRRRAEEAFSFDRYIDRVESLYQAVLAQ